MAEITLKLTEEKKIGGKKLLPGAVLFSGACASGVSPDDLNKAIQLGQVKVEIPQKEAPKKKDSDKK